MKTITQYREDIASLMTKVGEMDAKCIAENRDLTADELKRKNEYLDTVDDYRNIVATLERQAKVAAELEKPGGAATVPSDIKVGRDRRELDTFLSFGEQLAAVMNANAPGGHVDPRLRNIKAATGLGETVPSDGGFLVQQDFSDTLLQDTFETGLLAPRCKRVQISGTSNGIKINGIDETSRATNRYGGVLSYWLHEAGTKTASAPKFRQIELNLHKLIGLCYATDKETCRLVEQSISENPVNSGEALTDSAEGNPEPSLFIGRCNDYSARKYTQASGSAGQPYSGLMI